MLGLAAILLQIAVFLQPLRNIKFLQYVRLLSKHCNSFRAAFSPFNASWWFISSYDMTSSSVTKAEAKQNTTMMRVINVSTVLFTVTYCLSGFKANSGQNSGSVSCFYFFHVFFKLQQLFLIPQGHLYYYQSNLILKTLCFENFSRDYSNAFFSKSCS